MLTSRRENLRSVYVLLFLNIAFFFLEHQDAERYALLFSFDADAVRNGELWRLFTFQFTQSGQAFFVFPKAVVLFFTLLLLYIMGSAVEEAWGTARFLGLFAVSTLASAACAAVLGTTLLGSYFVNFSLLFIYAACFPQQTFYMFGLMPVRIRWIAAVAAFVLLAGVLAGSASNTAALAGAVAAFVWFLAVRVPAPAPKTEPAVAVPDRAPQDLAIRNAARFVGIRRAVAARSRTDIDRLSAQFARDVVAGVNICPPADFKPEAIDGYCIRCEGFPECSIRYLDAHRPASEAVAAERAPVTEAT